MTKASSLQNLILIIFVVCILGEKAFSNNLMFPIERSSVKALPQRFEYQLLNANQFRVGDLTINANDIGMRLNTSGKDRKFLFFWPPDLLESSELVIKDSSGKSVWRKKLGKQQVVFKKGSRGNRLATFEMTLTEEDKLFAELKRTPFIRFCAHQEAPQTKVYFCSKDLFLIKNQNGFAIQARNSRRPESFVEINGETVGNQGSIFLNSSLDSLSMRGLMLSGSTIEIDTRMKDVNFQDAVLSADGKTLIVTAKNREKDPLLRDQEVWTAQLNVDRPFLYLKGEGNIPLRQEFIVEGPVRKESVKVQITSTAKTATTSSSIDLDLRTPQNIELSSDDKMTELRKQSDGTYEWRLLGLRRNQVNRRFVRVTDMSTNPNQVFYAAYDIQRTSGFEALVYASYPLRVQAGLSWVGDDRWNFDLNYSSQIGTTKDFDHSSLISAAAYYRQKPGVHMLHPSARLGVFVDSFSSDKGNLIYYGIAPELQLKDLQIYEWNVPWTYLRVKAPLGAQDSFTVAGSFEVQTAVRLGATLDRFHEVGVKYKAMNFRKDRADLKQNQAEIFYGFGVLF